MPLGAPGRPVRLAYCRKPFMGSTKAFDRLLRIPRTTASARSMSDLVNGRNGAAGSA